MALDPLSLAFWGSLKRLRVDLHRAATAVVSVLLSMVAFTEHLLYAWHRPGG